MKRHIWIAISVLVTLLYGCGSAPQPSASANIVLQRLAAVDVDPDHYPSYARYHQNGYQQVADLVGELSSPSALKMLFYECHRVMAESPEAPQERLKWTDPHWEASNAILFRLADLNSDRATRTLIELFADDHLRWDGEGALNVCNAISRCGQRALPYLAEVKSTRWAGVIPDLVAQIEKGEFYGP